MAPPQRSKTSRSSSTAGEPDEAFDEPFSDDDLCGNGCFGNGVAPGDVHTVSCEHGKFKVTETTKRQAPRQPQYVPTVHDKSLHHESEQTIPADSGAVKHLLDHVNGHDERILKLEAAVERLQGIVLGLTSGPTQTPIE